MPSDSPQRPSDDAVPSANCVVVRLVERAKERLVELGFDPTDAFPARLVRDLLPSGGGRRLCLDAIYRAIGRRDLPTSRIGREHFTTIKGLAVWLARRSNGVADVVEQGEALVPDDVHAAVRARLTRRRRRGA